MSLVQRVQGWVLIRKYFVCLSVTTTALHTGISVNKRLKRQITQLYSFFMVKGQINLVCQVKVKVTLPRGVLLTLMSQILQIMR